MFDGWRWRYSRRAELTMRAAAIIGNRIPFNDEAVVTMDLLREFLYYNEDKG